MSNQKKLDGKAPMRDTSETETEPESELPVTKEEIVSSRSWKIGNLKEAAVAKTRKAGEGKKRIVVGLMIFAWYTAPIFIHPLAEVCGVIPMVLVGHHEIHNIKMKSFEEKPERGTPISKVS